VVEVEKREVHGANLRRSALLVSWRRSMISPPRCANG
jgi:hypothetical protein